MAISNVTLNSGVQNMKTTTVTSADSESKNLQNQINSKEQRLKRLSTDSEMTAEEKAKERQEVQKLIEELNRKLRLLQMEKKEETAKAAKEQEKKLQDTDKENAEEEESAKVRADRMEMLSPPVENIQKILVSDSWVQQERVQESVAVQKEGRMKILETEIKSDKLYGTDTTAKREELSSLRRQEPLEIEPKEQPKTPPNYVMDSGAKIIIR